MRVNALLPELPLAALQVSGGQVTRVAVPRVEGAWQVHELSLQLAAPNTPCTIVVPAGALSGAEEGRAEEWRLQGVRVEALALGQAEVSVL